MKSRNFAYTCSAWFICNVMLNITFFTKFMTLITPTTKDTFFQIRDSNGSTIGVFRGERYPPTVRSTRNRLVIFFESGTAGVERGSSKLGKGFLAYYKTIVPGPEFGVIMVASLTGIQYYPQAVAFLSSPLLDVSGDGNCLSFRYSLRSNFRVKITSHRRSITLLDWGVDGGRAFHRAAIDLPQGIYKIIWETTDSREFLGFKNSPHSLYRATVKDIIIHPATCQIVGRLCRLLFIATGLQGFIISVILSVGVAEHALKHFSWILILLLKTSVFVR